MADNWTDEMQAHFDELKRDIQSQFDKQNVALTAVIAREIDRSLGETERRLAEHIDNRLGTAEGRLDQQFVAAEARLGERFDAAEARLGERFDAAEGRLASQFRTGFEALRDQVSLLAEAFGGTIDGIKRDIRALDEKVDSTFDLHTKVLAEHSREIADLKRKL